MGVGVLVVVVSVLLSLHVKIKSVSCMWDLEIEYRCNQPVPHGFGLKMVVLPN